MNDEIGEKLWQSAKRSVAVPGQGRKGSYSGSRRLSAGCSRAESCLPGFVEDRR
jgi:hypothetical protein